MSRPPEPSEDTVQWSLSLRDLGSELCHSMAGAVETPARDGVGGTCGVCSSGVAPGGTGEQLSSSHGGRNRPRPQGGSVAEPSLDTRAPESGAFPRGADSPFEGQLSV